MKKSELPERVEFATSHSQSEFARQFGVSRSGACNFYKRYGIKNTRKFLSDHTEEEIGEFAVSHTLPEIAERFDSTESACRAFLRIHGISYIKRNRGRHSPCVDRNEMFRFLAQKYTYAAIGLAFGLTRERVRQICSTGEQEGTDGL